MSVFFRLLFDSSIIYNIDFPLPQTTTHKKTHKHINKGDKNSSSTIGFIKCDSSLLNLGGCVMTIRFSFQSDNLTCGYDATSEPQGRHKLVALVLLAALKCLAQQQLNAVNELNPEDLPLLFSPPAMAAH